MKFGLPLFGVSPRFYGEIAQAAEANGFESVWMPEHLVFPEKIPPTYLYSESGDPPVNSDTPLFDVWVALGVHRPRHQHHPARHQRLHPAVAPPHRGGALHRHPRPPLPRAGHARHRRRVVGGRVRRGGTRLPRPRQAHRRHDPVAPQAVERPGDRGAQRALRLRAGEVPAETAQRLHPHRGGRDHQARAAAGRSAR